MPTGLLLLIKYFLWQVIQVFIIFTYKIALKEIYLAKVFHISFNYNLWTKVKCLQVMRKIPKKKRKFLHKISRFSEMVKLRLLHSLHEVIHSQLEFHAFLGWFDFDVFRLTCKMMRKKDSFWSDQVSISQPLLKSSSEFETQSR